jgi:hypothetical protein
MNIAPTDLPTWVEVSQVIYFWSQVIVALVMFFGVITIGVNWSNSLRDQVRLNRDKWRISYRNLNISHEIVLTHTQGALRTPSATGSSSSQLALAPLGASAPTATLDLSQFLLFRLNVENIGDGPVDIWACLIAARELNVGDHHESWGGNVEWNDLDPYYFDTTHPDGIKLAGISNTRHTVYSQDDYLQLDPKERDALTRIDRIDPVTGYVTLLYRAFLVGRGYGGDRKTTEERDMLAWQRLQQALFNVSGPSFRILFDLDDPLDLVADRDGWQCFMLYHMAFVDDRRDQIGWTRIDWLNSQLEGKWGAEHTEAEARQLCADKLSDERARWQRHWEALKLAVAECKKLPRGFVDLMESNWKPDVSRWPQTNGIDLTGKTAKELFKELPEYLHWNPKDDDSLPVWEKFFVVSLSPESVAAAPASGSAAPRM